MADHALAAIRKHEIHGRDQKRLELRLYRLGNQPTRARSQDFGERIIDGPFLTEGNNSILGHGVTLLLGGSGGLITNPVTPPSSYRHPVSPVAHTRADEDGAFVGTDNRLSMGLMVDYLLRSGTSPSYIGMPAVNQNASERREGYETAMLERGAQSVFFDIPDLGWDFERLAFDEATGLFKAGAPVGGTILCANDRVAFGVMAAACQIGRSVGRLAELRIAGHDDHPLVNTHAPR